MTRKIVVSIVFTALAGGALAAAFLYPGVVLGLACVFVSFAVAQLIGEHVIVKFILRYRFKKEFGFEPGSDYGERLVQQPFVDAQLGYLAREFKHVCDQENAILSRGYATAQSGSQAVGELQSVRRLLKEAKDRFWSAHGVATKMKFSVLPRHGDYLA